MLTLRLPDGSARQVPEGTRPRDVAESIGKRLAQAAVAAKVDGDVVDLDRELSNGAARSPSRSSPRRTPKPSTCCGTAAPTSWPGPSCGCSPASSSPSARPSRTASTTTSTPPPRSPRTTSRASRRRWRKIVKRGRAVRALRAARPPRPAQLVRRPGQELQGRAHRRRAEASTRSLSFYRQGEFIDLCRGPHIPHAGKVGAFKLLSASPAPTGRTTDRASSSSGSTAPPSSTRRSSTPTCTRSRRRRSATTACSASSSSCSPSASWSAAGLILWMPKGAIVRGILETFIKDELIKRGYQPVYTPHIGRLELYRTSGHFPYYRDSQFPPMYFDAVAGASTWPVPPGRRRSTRSRSDARRAAASWPTSTCPAYRRGDDRRGAARSRPPVRAAKLLDGVQLELPEYHKATDAEERAKALLNWLSSRKATCSSR